MFYLLNTVATSTAFAAVSSKTMCVSVLCRKGLDGADPGAYSVFSEVRVLVPRFPQALVALGVSSFGLCAVAVCVALGLSGASLQPKNKVRSGFRCDANALRLVDSFQNLKPDPCIHGRERLRLMR